MALATREEERHPVSLHIYRNGGLLSDDKVVKDQQKTVVLYVVKGTRTDTSFALTIHVGSPDGPPACRVASTYGNFNYGLYHSNSLNVTIFGTEERPGGWQTTLTSPSAFDGTYWFRGPDRNEYRWRTTSLFWRNDLQCLDSRDSVVATYRVTTLAMHKDGELRVYPSGRFMIELLLATSLAMRTPSA